jgi:threonine-phosphate decarboxylase
MNNSSIAPRHGGQLEAIATMFDIPATELLDFSANISPDGPPAGVIDVIRHSLEDLSAIRSYPDLESLELRREIAKYAETSAGNIVVANGFVPLLETALRTLTVKRCLLAIPAFIEYRNTLERVGVEVVPHTVDARRDFRYEPAMLFEGACDAILIANPQNPSGVIQDADTLLDIVHNASQRKVRVLLDEAFIDYIPSLSLITLVEDFPNLIVFRSVTKFHGIPGFRVAYAVTHQSLAAAISANLPPWPITTLAAMAAATALADRPYAERTREENQLRRTALVKNLEAIGLCAYPAAANFLLFPLPDQIPAEQFWEEMITKHMIVVRSCSNYEGLVDQHVRVAVRTRTENERLVLALQQCLSSVRSYLKA